MTLCCTTLRSIEVVALGRRLLLLLGAALLLPARAPLPFFKGSFQRLAKRRKQPLPVETC